LGFGEKYQEKKQNEYIGLDPTSIKIFEYLKSNINKPVSINSLSNHTWGECNIIKRNAIYVYIRKIRIYIGDNLDFPTKLIKCNKGFYTLRQL
ncbi:MAG: helix-turn-helix domain-containing protein, partial [Spirochaetaceae bacterium]|nr:helix-turn-helix domain-containing protein [Spirochaetaceae bacterium]